MPSVLRDAVKRMAMSLAGDYAIYRLFALDLQQPLRDPHDDLARAGFKCAPVTGDEVMEARAGVIRESARYDGRGSQAFAILRDGEIVALEWYWFGEHRRDDAFWPLADGEAESAYIVTVPELRGQGLAQLVKEYSAIEMRKRGFRRAYGKIWHTNHASIRANQKSGFREVALVVDVYPFGASPALIADGEVRVGRRHRPLTQRLATITGAAGRRIRWVRRLS